MVPITRALLAGAVVLVGARRAVEMPRGAPLPPRLASPVDVLVPLMGAPRAHRLRLGHLGGAGRFGLRGREEQLERPWTAAALVDPPPHRPADLVAGAVTALALADVRGSGVDEQL